MMLLSIITLLFSFLLQGIISNYLGYHLNHLSWFTTIYPLINLLILVPYFENNTKKMVIILIVGLLMDMVYANTGFLNLFLFVVTYYFSKSFHFFFPYNLLTINVSNVLAILLYHFVTFLFLSLLRYDSYGFSVLLRVLSHSVVMTIIYSSVIYLLIDFIVKKFNLREVK